MTTGTIISPGYRKTWSGLDGKDRQNPYTMTAESSYDGTWSHSGTGWTVSSHPGTGAGLLGFNYPAPILDDDVLDRLKQKVSSQKFSAGIFLAEGRESLEMITQAATRLNDAVTSFEHKNAKGILRALGVTPVGKALSATAKALSAGFLAWNFGWKPVLSDMASGAETLHRMIDVNDDIAAARKQRIVIVRRGPAIMARGAGGGFIEIGRQVLTSHSLSYESAVKEALGVGNLTKLAYDIVPLSFVANWVLPVGDYLDRLHTASIFDGHSACITNWTRTHVSIGSFAMNVGGVDGVWVGSYQASSIQLSRSVTNALSFAITPPLLQVPQTLFAASTAAALLVQRLLK